MVDTFLFCLLSLMVGFTVRRAGICLVRATQEVIERKPPKVMIFIAQALLVALFVTLSATYIFSERINRSISFPVDLRMLAAAFIYGIGIAINGACALGTLNALFSGRVSYLFTIIGFVVGYLAFLSGDISQPIPIGYNTFQHSLIYSVSFFLSISFLMLFAKRSANKNTLDEVIPTIAMANRFITDPVNREFFAIVTLGLASGLLYLLGGSWDYTNWMMHCVLSISDVEHLMPPHLGKTATGLISGIIIATIISKGFNFDLGRPKIYLRNFLGGILMAFGAALIPGGNDTIILYAMPGLALHAIPALLAIILGVSFVLLFNRWRLSLHG